MIRPCSLRCLLFVISLLTGGAAIANDSKPLWNLDDLDKAPKFTFGDEVPAPVGSAETVREIYYEGEAFRGKPTRIFAYYAAPKESKAKLPAMVLIHGGGGTAFPQWARLWAQRGYVAIAMDLGGVGPKKQKLDDGGPAQADTNKFYDIKNGDKDAWPYHAVANVIRAHSLLRSMPEVDANRTGVTGISWGGYLTSIVMSVDHRFKVAVPVYGCGYLAENSTWLKYFETLGPDLTKKWTQLYDPSSYLADCKTPCLWVNGTNDFAYPLDSYRKSYRLVKGPRTLCVTVRMPHGHEQGWAPKEIGLFVDSVLTGGKPLAKISTMKREGAAVSATFEAPVKVVKAGLHYTTDPVTGPGAAAWAKRNWQSTDAAIEGEKVSAKLPAEEGIVFFMTITDERGATVSTEHEVIE